MKKLPKYATVKELCSKIDVLIGRIQQQTQDKPPTPKYTYSYYNPRTGQVEQLPWHPGIEKKINKMKQVTL